MCCAGKTYGHCFWTCGKGCDRATCARDTTDGLANPLDKGNGFKVSGWGPVVDGVAVGVGVAVGARGVIEVAGDGVLLGPVLGGGVVVAVADFVEAGVVLLAGLVAHDAGGGVRACGGVVAVGVGQFRWSVHDSSSGRELSTLLEFNKVLLK